MNPSEVGVSILEMRWVGVGARERVTIGKVGWGLGNGGALRTDIPHLSFPQGQSWIPVLTALKWSIVGDTPLAENSFPFFAAWGHQWVTLVWLSSKKWRQEMWAILCRSMGAAVWYKSKTQDVSLFCIKIKDSVCNFTAFKMKTGRLCPEVST